MDVYRVLGGSAGGWANANHCCSGPAPCSLPLLQGRPGWLCWGLVETTRVSYSSSSERSARGARP
eukprot:335351-Alexandrium_andersonii.AAC.1